eukprot:6214440-Pleurochrysis_carterae.AAC.1
MRPCAVTLICICGCVSVRFKGGCTFVATECTHACLARECGIHLTGRRAETLCRAPPVEFAA